MTANGNGLADHHLFAALDECIDCALCVTECPANAIFPEDDVPDDRRRFFEINAELAPVWPAIAQKIDAPPDADEWNGRPGKLPYLEKEPGR